VPAITGGQVIQKAQKPVMKWVTPAITGQSAQHIAELRA
jgi:hypothetical protein